MGIKQRIKYAFYNLCPLHIADELFSSKFDWFNNISFSQEGEDLVLDRFLNNKKKGFYIDVGAHHPVRFSNTYKFYLRGWNGINIDAMPGSMSQFNKIRPNDINLELAISDKAETLTYYIFNEPALNTFSKKEADLHNGVNSYNIIDKKEINTYTLKDIIDKYLAKNIHVDFMSIDVEGLDMAVLSSNDWVNCRPTFLLVESLRENLNSINNNPIYIYLSGLNYLPVAKTYNTIFFKDGQV